MKILLYLLLLRAVFSSPYAIEPVPESSQSEALPGNPSFTVAGAPAVDPEFRARLIQDSHRKDINPSEVTNKGIGEKVDDYPKPIDFPSAQQPVPNVNWQNVDPAFSESLPQPIPQNEPKAPQPAQSVADQQNTNLEPAKANFEPQDTNADINQEQEKADVNLSSFPNEKPAPSDAQIPSGISPLTAAGAQVLDPALIAKVKQDSTPPDVQPVVVNAEVVKAQEPVDSPPPQQPVQNVNWPNGPEPLPEPIPQNEPKARQPVQLVSDQEEANVEQAKAKVQPEEASAHLSPEQTKVNLNPEPANVDRAQSDGTNANQQPVKVTAAKVPTQVSADQQPNAYPEQTKAQDNPAPNLQVIIPPTLPHFVPMSDAELLLRQSLPEILLSIVDTPAQLIPKENLQPEFLFQPLDTLLQPGLPEAFFSPVSLPSEGEAPPSQNTPQEPIREDVRTDIPKNPSELRPSAPSAWPNRIIDSMDSKADANQPLHPKVLVRPPAFERSPFERQSVDQQLPERNNEEVLKPVKPKETLQPFKPAFQPQRPSIPANIGLFPFLNCFLAPNVDKKLFLRYFEQLGQVEAAAMPEANPGMLLQIPMQLEPILSRLQTQHPEQFRQLVQQWQANPVLLQNVQQDPDSYLSVFHENPEFVINPQLAINVFLRRFELLQLLEILRNATWLKEVMVQSPDAMTHALQSPQAMVPEVIKLAEQPEYGPQIKELLTNNPDLLRLLLNDRHLFTCLEFLPSATLQLLQIMNTNPPLLQSSLSDPKLAVELCDKLGEHPNLFQRIQENPAVISEVIGGKWQQPEIINRDPVVVCYLNA